MMQGTLAKKCTTKSDSCDGTVWAYTMFTASCRKSVEFKRFWGFEITLSPIVGVEATTASEPVWKAKSARGPVWKAKSARGPVWKEKMASEPVWKARGARWSSQKKLSQ
jgi:hypothetical protein